MSARVRCPNPECEAEFHLPLGRLGRNVYCIECGRRMTAKPVDVAERLAEKARRIAGGVGRDGPRLPLAAVLDNVRSLWNVGSMFRTADLCGVEHLFLAGITGCPPRPEITKTALGADEAVAWSYSADAAGAVDTALARGFTPVAVERSSRSVALADAEWPARPCLVFGNEVVGVADALLERCPVHVEIPMLGRVKESFNVAVAFGIAMQRAAETLRKPESGSTLPEGASE